MYILIQTSGSMRGGPINAVNDGLETLIGSFRQDPFALETMWISIVTFNRRPKQILPLTELTSLEVPVVTQPDAGGAHLGEALEFVCKKINNELVKTTAEVKGNYKPLIVIMCDGRVNDISIFHKIIPEVKLK